jgi:hypothetical protein
MITFAAINKRMGKQRKHILTLEYEYNYEMFGLCSHHVDYRLVWGINDKLDLQLEKTDEDFVVVNKKGQQLSCHSLYEYLNSEDAVEYFLIKNKGAGKFLIPEKQEVDYFLFIRDNHPDNSFSLPSKLRSVSSVLAVFEFNPVELASTENLIF